MATESFGWGCSLPEALRNIELTPESPSSHQFWLGKRLATGWLRTNHLYAEAQVAVFPSGIGTIRGSAGRTRTYNQWINSHAHTVRVVLMGVGKCRSVYVFEPYVLPGAVPCGVVRLHIWLHTRCGALALSRAILPDSERVIWLISGFGGARYALPT